MQKALFLNLVLPLLAFLSWKKVISNKQLLLIILSTLSILILSSVLIDRTWDLVGQREINYAEYFSSYYLPQSVFDYMTWRIFSIPIFTATDTLQVHAENFGGEYFLGATSALVAGILGVDRINLERFVFAHQYGWSDIANANAVFYTDAYANFGLIGVIVYGMFVGQVFRWFRKSKDPVFFAFWPLFAYSLFSANLLGILFSNGFLLILVYALWFKLRPASKPRSALKKGIPSPAATPGAISPVTPARMKKSRLQRGRGHSGG